MVVFKNIFLATIFIQLRYIGIMVWLHIRQWYFFALIENKYNTFRYNNEYKLSIGA